MTDVLHTLWFPRLHVRGAIVALRQSVAEVWRRGGYPTLAAEALGETLAASALFSSGMKVAHKLSIQLQGAPGLRLLFAECSHGGRLRGIARIDPGQPLALLPAAPGAVLAITIEPNDGEQRYQGIVPLEGGSLAEVFCGYFERSEQLPTRLLLASDGVSGAAGLLLQRVALTGGEPQTVDPDGWNRLGFLLDTVRAPELLGSEPLDLVRRVFGEEEVELTASQPLAFACSCSRERVAAVLTSLGRAECEAALGSTRRIEITCEFCGQQYQFDAIEVESLFHPAVQPAPDALM